MFNNKKSEKIEIEEKQKTPLEVLTFLGVGTEFKGKIIFQGTLRIDGFMEGEIEGSDTLVLGENGNIKGICRVGKAIISGKFKGDLFGEEKIILKNNADVEGKLVTPCIVIEEGATFNGSCKMGNAALTEPYTKEEQSSTEHIIKV